MGRVRMKSFILGKMGYHRHKETDERLGSQNSKYHILRQEVEDRPKQIKVKANGFLNYTVGQLYTTEFTTQWVSEKFKKMLMTQINLKRPLGNQAEKVKNAFTLKGKKIQRDHQETHIFLRLSPELSLASVLQNFYRLFPPLPTLHLIFNMF